MLVFKGQKVEKETTDCCCCFYPNKDSLSKCTVLCLQIYNLQILTQSFHQLIELHETQTNKCVDIYMTFSTSLNSSAEVLYNIYALWIKKQKQAQVTIYPSIHFSSVEFNSVLFIWHQITTMVGILFCSVETHD